MSKKRNYQEVYEYFTSQEYELISKEYINAHQKLQYKCPNGHIHEMTWNNFQRGKRCPECRDEKLRKERKHDKNKIIEAFKKEGYTVISDYYNARTPIKYICPNGHENECSYDNWMKGNRCPECLKNIWNIEKASKYFAERGYELLEKEYINYSTPMKVKCPNNHITYKTMGTFYAGHGCNLCNNHKKEKAINDILIAFNLEFEREKRFKDCRDSKPLPFDFYIPSLNVCIEYDGEQHYKPIDFTSKGKDVAEKHFVSQQRRDEIKTKFCENNNIKLIRIPYWEFDNAEDILRKELNIL